QSRHLHTVRELGLEMSAGAMEERVATTADQGFDRGARRLIARQQQRQGQRQRLRRLGCHRLSRQAAHVAIAAGQTAGQGFGIGLPPLVRRRPAQSLTQGLAPHLDDAVTKARDQRLRDAGNLALHAREASDPLQTDARSSDSMAANASGAALARAAAANSRVLSSPPRTKPCSSATCSVVGRPTACWKSARLNAWVRSLA